MSDLDLGLLIMISFISANFFYLHYRLNDLAKVLETFQYEFIVKKHIQQHLEYWNKKYPSANTNIQD